MSSEHRPPIVALASIARPTFDLPLARATAEQAAAAIGAAGLALAGPGSELLVDSGGAEQALAALRDQPFDLLVLLQASFADSTIAVRAATLAQEAGLPLLLWAVPEARTGERLRLNSLCGINLAGHALTVRGIAYDYLLAPPDEPAAIARIATLARAGAARRALSGARIGVVGQHPEGFEPCAYDAGELAAIFGAAVVPIELGAALARARDVGAAPREAFVARAAAHAPNLTELDRAAVYGTAGVYAALRAYADEQRLDGVAVRCWPEYFTELGCAACGAMSMLNDECTPASCEADVHGTLTLVLLRALSGAPAFIADLVSVDVASDTAALWHCGLAPPSMADPEAGVRGALHSNRRLPLLFEFPLRPGRVTLARISRTRWTAGRAGYRLVIGGGEMLRAPRSFSGTTGVIRFDRPAGEVLDTVMGAGLEHHLCLVYGDYRAELRSLARLVGLELLELC
ncbi:MAG: L-fucose/L-arabinose isomerase family protein [Chloroflexi bacterium OHK40]